MRKLLVLISVLLYFDQQAQNISTFAGTGVAGNSGDGGLATAATFNFPEGVVADNLGNIFVSDYNNNRIRKISSSGIITTIAGGGNCGTNYCGDGGPATSAQLYHPVGLAVDANNNLYIADKDNGRVRMINSSGIISTVAGSTLLGFSGDGGLATAAALQSPTGVALDASNNLYIADSYNYRIRKVNSSGIISTIAGSGTSGFSGDGGQAISAQLNLPYGVVADFAGNIYIADYNNNRIRKVNSSGVISTIAGSGTAGFSGDGGQATMASFNKPAALAFDGVGNLYIADVYNNRIRKINLSGVVSTVAGGGSCGVSYCGDGGSATAAQLATPIGLSFNSSGNLYIADFGNNRVRKVTTLTTDLKQESKEVSQITIYPNPAHSNFTIESKSETSIVVTNILGETILTQQLQEGKNEIDLSNYANGIYFIKSGNLTFKIIKQ